MIQADRIRAARVALERVTPLKTDCGRQCGAKCCRPDEEGKGGMVLFPGEEALYAPAPDWVEGLEEAFAVQGKPVLFLTCKGFCDRAERPLSCRIFPLTPVAENGRISVEMDVRAWPVCPLMEHGKTGLSRDFVESVREAMEILWEDAACRAYIELLTEAMKEYKALQ